MFLLLLWFSYGKAYGQQIKKDSITVKQLDDVVVTATKTVRKQNDVPLPTTVITQSAIEKMGALRLNDVLSEITGLQIVRSTEGASGIQMQGLNSEYVLILIDGEPVIGRVNNTLDLTRLAVGNIERIEIVKGPSSSLFGSEAIGGVINIITKKAANSFSGDISSAYRKNNVLEMAAEAGNKAKKASWYLFANRQSGDGFFAPNSVDNVTQTVPPYQAYTLNGKFSYQPAEHSLFNISAKFYHELQTNHASVQGTTDDRITAQRQMRQDFSINPSYILTISARQRLQVRNYTTWFASSNNYRYTDDGSLYSSSRFKQLFDRTEVQYDNQLTAKHLATIGMGDAVETVNATTYAQGKPFNQFYIYGQDQFRVDTSFNVIAGFRYDRHNQYADRFSPKIAAGWKVSRLATINASVSGGYKAPTFEQLLLNFTNPTVGYTVLGVRSAVDGLKALQAQGQIASVLIDPATASPIRAESSIAYNLGARFYPTSSLQFGINLFRNNINNLIDFDVIAIKTNRSTVYSYFNHNRVYTQGLELQGDYLLSPNFTLSAGYQYLVAKDQDVEKQIKDGTLYYRDQATGADRKVTPAMYGGLYDRSKNSGNIKLNYTSVRYKFDISVRAMYRGRFGSGADVNGNLILDDKREYAPGYTLVNLTVRKTIKSFTFEAGCNDLTNARTAYDPSIVPYNWYSGATLKF